MAAHIVIDARKLGDFGIGVYIENLIRGLAELQQSGVIDVRLTLLVPPLFLEAGAPVAVQQFIAEIDKGAVFVAEPAGKYSFSELFLLTRRQRPHLAMADLYHSPHFTLPYFIGLPAVVTIHDVIHVTRPEKLSHRLMAKPLIRSAARRADQIISVSAASAEMIRRIAAPLKTPITVVGNALQAGIEVLPRREIAQWLETQEFGRNPYCLFVGNERPHKGFAELLQAWAMLVKRTGARNTPELIAVGERYSSTAHDMVRKLALEDKVRFAGRVSRDTLCRLYNAARLVVAPSREEGFGLVALESLACGVPVLCTPHASFQEVCGDAAWYAEDFSAEALSYAVENVLGDALQRRRKVELGLERIRRFTRAAVAERTCAVYEKALAPAAEELDITGSAKKRHRPVLFRAARKGRTVGVFVEQLEQSARRKV